MPFLFVGLVVVLLAALASSSTVRETVAKTAGTILDMIRVKPGVETNGLQPEAWRIVSEAGALWRERGGEDLTLTSAMEGSHSAQSLHFQGLAVDLRTRDLSKAEILDRANQLLGRLGGGYDVIIEADHLHVEYDGRSHVAVNFHPPSLAAAYA